jgi:hypothetical protein
MCDQGFDLELRHNILSGLTHCDNNTFILVYFDNVRTTPDSRRETRAHVAWKKLVQVYTVLTRDSRSWGSTVLRRDCTSIE